MHHVIKCMHKMVERGALLLSNLDKIIIIFEQRVNGSNMLDQLKRAENTVSKLFVGDLWFCFFGIVGVALDVEFNLFIQILDFSF